MDHERVAALHDGKLDAREQDELLAAIAADDDESWLFAETAAVLADLEAAHAGATPADTDPVHPADGDAPPATFTAGPPPSPVAADGEREDDGVIPLATRRPAVAPAAGTESETAARKDDGVIPIESRRRSPARPWLVYGAMAAVLAGIGVTAALLSRSANARFDDPHRAVAMLDGGAARGIPANWNDIKRGADDHYTPEGRAVQIGAHMVDLELAAAARDTFNVRDIARKIAALLEGQAGGGVVDGPYQELANGAADIPKLVSDGREGVRQLLKGDGLELGIWGETARAAAMRRDAAFFRLRATRQALDRAAALPDPDGKIGPALGSVRAALPADGRATNWAALEQRLSGLLRAAGR